MTSKERNELFLSVFKAALELSRSGIFDGIISQAIENKRRENKHYALQQDYLALEAELKAEFGEK